jgi:hypothetical protein
MKLKEDSIGNICILPSGLAPRKAFDFDTMRPGTKYEHFL